MNDNTNSTSSSSTSSTSSCSRRRLSSILIALLAGISLLGIQSGSTRQLLSFDITTATTNTTAKSRLDDVSSGAAAAADINDDDTENDTVVAPHFRSIQKNVSTFLQDLDFNPESGDNMACGMFKCWIPSKSHPNYGYTLTQSYKQHDIASMTTGWEYGIALQQKYNHNNQNNTRNNTDTNSSTDISHSNSTTGITHFEHLYIRDLPPVVLSNTTTANLTIVLNTALRALGKKTHKSLYIKNQDYIVQVMRKMPNHSVTFCTQRSVWDFRHNILEPLVPWVQQYVLANNNNANASTLFLERLHENARQLQLLIQHERQLLNDFQFILDPTGRIIHFDLDRIVDGFKCAPQMVHNRIELFVAELTHLITTPAAVTAIAADANTDNNKQDDGYGNNQTTTTSAGELLLQEQ